MLRDRRIDENRKKVHEKEKRNEQKQSMIISSFFTENSAHPSTVDIDFLIHKINSNELWSVKHMAIGQLFQIVHFGFPKQCFQTVFETTLSLLDEKRSKVYEQAYEAFKTLLQCKLSTSLLTLNVQKVVCKSLKVQKVANDILPQILKMEPQKYFVLFCQYSVDVKSIKQKTILLDIVAEALSQISLDQSKVTTVTKLICKNIQKYYNHKQVYLPSFAILSYFKESYPETLLGSLLCQDNQILTKIINIAEEIDPQLREGIIDYIHQIKGGKINQIKIKVTDEDNHLAKIREQGLKLNESSDYDISELAHYVFLHYSQFSAHHFVELIKLQERIINENQLVDLELLLTELCKTQSTSYLEGLFRVIQSYDERTIESEYIMVHLQKIGEMMEREKQSVKVVDRLVNMYRISKNGKVRKSVIKILSQFQNSQLKQKLNEKEFELVTFYKREGFETKISTKASELSSFRSIH